MLKLSVCMIVRNAETVLPRCLDSLNGHYDQLCIVDTGSSDGTANLAQNHADVFETYHGCNDKKGNIIDFADARNHCLALATGDWILSIDADEILNLSDGFLIQEHLYKPATAAAISISRGNTDWLAIRLFKNIPEQKYHHAVHEVINVSGKTLTLRDIRIRDLGQTDKFEPSAQRNLRICEHILQQQPNDLRAQFYRAEALRKLGQYTQAGAGYMDCLEHPQLSTPYRCATLEALAACFAHTGRWQEAHDAAKLITQIHPGLAESYCIMGDALLAQRNLTQAKACYQHAASLSYPPKNYNLFVRKSSYQDYPLKQLESLRQVCEKHAIDFEGL